MLSFLRIWDKIKRIPMGIVLAAIVTGCQNLALLMPTNALSQPMRILSVRFYQKPGGQIRTNLRYLGQDLIVWYPLLEGCSAIGTRALAWQLWQFGGLPAEEFKRLFGKSLMI